jgi:membrane AbrB-like protein
MDTIRSLIVALVGGLLFERLHVPAGALLGAMVGVAALNLANFGVAPSGPGTLLRFAAFAIIGWELGARITPQTLDAVRKAALPIVVVVAGLMVASVVLAFVLHRSGVDPVTAFLAASPGGLSQMVAISTDLGANVVVVSIVHLIRIIAVLVTAPLIARLLSG